MKVGDCSVMTARAAPVVAFTSMTRYVWWPRSLPSNVKPRESAYQENRLIANGFGNSDRSITVALPLVTSNNTGSRRSTSSPGLRYKAGGRVESSFGWTWSAGDERTKYTRRWVPAVILYATIFFESGLQRMELKT